MLRSKGLRLQIAVLAVLVATSAFAESRHLGGTRGGGHSWSGGGHSWSHSSFGRSAPSRSWSGARSFAPSRSFPSRGFAPSRGFSRGFSGRSFAPRSVAPRAFGRSWRGGGFRGTPFRGFNSGDRFFGRGRIDRIVPFRGGFRVWLGGWGFPFFVPFRFFDPFRFRVGLFIGFNAFYDPLGFYNVYDPYYYPYPPPTVVVQQPAYGDTPYYDGSGGEYGSSIVRGTVQSADISRDTMWVNDEISRKVVTVLMPPDRALNNVRAGDYVEVSGEWKSDGVFDGHALDRYDPHH